MAGRRILITGLSSPLGGRLAQALERDPQVEAIVGIDSEDPRHELERTEFVRVELARRPVQRIIAAAEIETVLDTRVLSDALLDPPQRIHAVNVSGTKELLAACAAATTVHQLVFKSSAAVYGWEPGSPAFVGEDGARSAPARTAIEREVRAAEAAVREFSARHPKCRVAALRVADELGGTGRGSLVSLLSLPAIPAVLGFDPRLQAVHFDDVVGALAHATSARCRGVFNVAADGVLALSEVASLLGKPLLPVLPPWGTGFAAGQLRRLGLRVPVEMLRALRYGRGLDNRRLKATGYAYAYTTREALLKLRADQRLRPLLGSGPESYHYDPGLEAFLRWSPSVRRGPAPPAVGAPSRSGYDGLGAGELIDLIPSLDPAALRALRVYELEHGGRPEVLEALQSTLERKAN